MPAGMAANRASKVFAGHQAHIFAEQGDDGLFAEGAALALKCDARGVCAVWHRVGFLRLAGRSFGLGHRAIELLCELGSARRIADAPLGRSSQLQQQRAVGRFAKRGFVLLGRFDE